jgi:transposase
MSTKHGRLSSQELKRLQGGELIHKGYDNDEIADIVEVSVSAVKKWRKKLKNNGNDSSCLSRKPGSGKPSTLNEEQKQQLKEIILGGAIAAGYPTERWTSKIVADLIHKTFDVVLAPRTVRDLLPTLGLSPQLPVVKSHKHDDEEALRWATQQWKRIKKSEKARHYLDFLGRNRFFTFSDSRNDLGRNWQTGCIARNLFTTIANGCRFYYDDTSETEVELLFFIF